MDNTIWFNLGRFAILDCNLSFNPSELLMTLNLADLMAFLDGTLGGDLSHEIRMINKGLSVRQAVISVLQGLVPYSIERIEVDGLEMNLPYDIEKPSGSTAYEIVSELSNLYMGYQFYYDENGYFKLTQIKDKRNQSRNISDSMDFHTSLFRAYHKLEYFHHRLQQRVLVQLLLLLHRLSSPPMQK